MSAPAPALVPLPSWAHLSTHVKHVIIAIAAVVLLWIVVVRGEDLWIRLKTLDAQKTQAQLAQAQDALKQAASDRQAADDRYRATVSQVLAANRDLAQQMANRDKALADGLKTLQNTPPTALAARLSDDLGLQAGEVQGTADGLVLGHSGAIATVAAVESGKVAQADLADTQKQLAGVTNELGQANGLIDSLRKESAGKDVVLADAKKACDAQVALVKSKARKRNFITSTITYIGGVISGVVLGRRL